ncbi:DUF6885 family protein [Actinocorallia sp. A-T 12471]|uniref:DUF6885 family protein n=1 Tax=Actinocorallia sp. A-T 12471 TaxID=3089813 RepID=UPI0029CBA821|nr:hypothetical protein [Actinocorallia sp. A-T 12471]MDX6744893.1 hypothetical protein [Actinocorallia sp. A-T 12471]
MVGPARLERVVRLPGAAALLAAHRRALPQPDQMCGPFWARLAVAALLGTEGLPGIAEFAAAAGTAIWPGDLAAARPPGEPPHTDAWAGVARAGSPDGAGTSASGVGAAIELLSSGAVAAVPATGQWTGEGLLALLDGLAARDLAAVPVANPDTGELWGSRPAPGLLDAYLADGDAAHGPPPDWRVGHFAGLWGTLRGPAGTLVAVADTYPVLGARGLHLQPVERLGAALARGAPRTGGVVLAVPARRRDDAVALVRDSGLEPVWWDNGTEYHGR